MPLFQVFWQLSAVVKADSAEDALDVVDLHEVARDSSHMRNATRADPIQKASDLQDGWDGKCLVYGTDTDQTVLQVLVEEAMKTVAS